MLPESFKKLFRNYCFNTIDPDAASGQIIITTLAYGTWEQIEWIFNYYGWNRIREIFLDDFHGRRELPEPTRRLWVLAFLDETPAEDTDQLARWRCRRRVPPSAYL